MNAKQLQYAIELSESGNFSKAAEKLNITQPALSKQILMLEKELGVRLFDRSCNPMRLTAAGERFIKEAKELVFKEKQIKTLMQSYSSGERGRLSIGLSPFRCLYLMPDFAKKFRERYPEVEISISDANSEVIRRDVADGKLDLAILNLPVDETLLEYKEIEADTLVLAVPNTMLSLLGTENCEKLSNIDFGDCRNLPFVACEPAREMRSLFDGLCAKSEFTPKIAMEVVGITTAWTMAQAGIGATIVPLQFIGGAAPSIDTVTLLRIKDNTYSRKPAIVTRRGRYLPEYAKYAIELLSEKGEN